MSQKFIFLNSFICFLLILYSLIITLFNYHLEVWILGLLLKDKRSSNKLLFLRVKISCSLAMFLLNHLLPVILGRTFFLCTKKVHKIRILFWVDSSKVKKASCEFVIRYFVTWMKIIKLLWVILVFIYFYFRAIHFR